MKARLNLATKPVETHRRFLAVSGLIGLVAGIVFLALGWSVYSKRKANETLRVKVAQIRQELGGLERERTDLDHFFAQQENAKLHERSAFLNTLIDEQSLNWTQMFMDLEKILPPGVRVVSIEPTHEKGGVQVKLIVGAASDEAKLKFLHALEESHAFSHVKLVAEKVATFGNGNTDRTQVELTAVYSKS
jgi:type IV pilus assembly protein PilN